MNLRQFFESQDKTLETHLSSSKLFRESFDVISNVYSLITDAIPQLPFQREKKEVLGIFAVEIATAVCIATRLALSGNTPESLSILRLAIERGTQLVFVVSEAKYKTALYEVENGFDQVSYETAFRSMGDFGKRLERLHGQISGTASHASAIRINWYSLERDNKVLFGPVYEREDDRVAIALEWCLDSLVIVADCLAAAYKQESLPFRGAEQYATLWDSYRSLKTEYDKKLKRGEKGSGAASS